MSFARPNKVPEFAPRRVLGSKDARTLARELISMTEEEFRASFNGRR